MSVRSTYALDQETASTIRKLAEAWNASQAEVIRRAVRQTADRQESMNRMTPAEALDFWRTNPPPRKDAETRRIIARMRADRHAHDTERSRLSDKWRREP
jgi:hypothetical protein